MRKFLIDRYERLSRSEFGEILGHARNYLSGNLATKALGIVSLPVFTRLLTERDYGIVSVYNATFGLAAIILTLNSSRAVSRYFHEKDKHDFPEFLNSILFWQISILVPSVIVMYLFVDVLFPLIGLPTDVYWFFVVSLFYAAIMPLYRQYLVASKNSKPYVWLNVINGYGNFGLSWLLLELIKGSRYILRIAGFVVFQGLAMLWMVSYLFRKGKFQGIQLKHIRYSLSFGIPHLPYALSGTILSQFDRIMLSSISSPAEAGIYSVAYNVGGLILLVITALQPAFLPNFFELMNKQKYQKIDQLNKRLFWIVAAAAIGLIVLGKPLLYLLASPKFHGGAGIIPLIVGGMVFWSFTAVYNRYASFAKKTIYLSISAFVAAVINILLNYILIPKYHIYGAAYATLVSYFVQALLSWLLIVYVADFKVATSPKKFIVPLLSILLIIMAIMLLN